MSNSLQSDLALANTVLAGKSDNKFNRIYTNTNERLDYLFDNIDVSNKNVLTVLSSSDYLFMLKKFGANKVDCFDINPLTHRYFYLRKWLLENEIIDITRCSYVILCAILDRVSRPHTEYERESLFFWKEVFAKLKDCYNYANNKILNSTYSPLNYHYYDINELIRIVRTTIPEFYNINIAEEFNLGKDKKYDCIFLSNILDYNRYPDRLEIVIKNLLPLLNSDGKVICTHIPKLFEELDMGRLKLERQCFERNFDYNYIGDVGGNHAFYQYTLK